MISTFWTAEVLPGSNLGGILSGWAHDTTGSYAPAFTVLAVVNGLSLALLLAVRYERRVLEQGSADPRIPPS